MVSLNDTPITTEVQTDFKSDKMSCTHHEGNLVVVEMANCNWGQATIIEDRFNMSNMSLARHFRVHHITIRQQDWTLCIFWMEEVKTYPKGDPPDWSIKGISNINVRNWSRSPQFLLKPPALLDTLMGTTLDTPWQKWRTYCTYTTGQNITRSTFSASTLLFAHGYELKSWEYDPDIKVVSSPTAIGISNEDRELS